MVVHLIRFYFLRKSKNCATDELNLEWEAQRCSFVRVCPTKSNLQVLTAKGKGGDVGAGGAGGCSHMMTENYINDQ